MTLQTLTSAWYRQLTDIVGSGRPTKPRDQLTYELPSKTLVFDMNYPVITMPERELGYRFMCAEAWWILDGRDDVETIKPYAKHIVNFSDDGHKFFGAYGPRIVAQLDYVVDALIKDRDTRQAVLTTWQPNPPVTKDVPCTVAFSWLIRNGKIECHVFMRSSDNWLGIPYDAFNFTMLTVEIARRYNLVVGVPDEMLELGAMHLTAASSHVYDRDMEKIQKVLRVELPEITPPVPRMFYQESMTPIKDILNVLKDSAPGYTGRWWEQ